MMTTTTLARERNGSALREKLNPYVVSFLGFERALSLSLFLPTSMRLIFLRRVFSGLMPFSVFHQFSCFSRRFLFIYMGFFRLRLFYGFSWLCRSLLTRDMHQSCLSCWKLLSSVCSCFCWAASWNWNMGGRFLLSYRSLERWQDCRDNSPKSFNMLGLRCFVYFPLFFYSLHQFGIGMGPHY